MSDAPPPDPALIDALVAAIRARHPAIAEADLPRLRQHVERLQTSVAALDAYPLANADEPDASFHVAEPED